MRVTRRAPLMIAAAVLAVVLFAASRTVKNDVARLQAWMKSADAQAKAS